MSKISVIVPIYKVEEYIHRCVNSILSQTFRDIEIILVNDGSPDDCGKICDEYKQQDERIIVIHKENGGLSSARNAGLDWVFQNSDSQWISFVDSDDWIHPEMISRLYEAREKNNVKLSSCGYEKTEFEFHEFKDELLVPKIMEASYFYRHYGVNATIAWGKLYNRICFENIRYPEGKLHEDEFTTYKIIFECNQVAMIEAPLYAYYVNPNSIMNKWTPKRLDSMDAYRERIEFFKNLGLTDLQHEQEKGYIWNIVNHIKSIEQSDENIRKQYEKKLRLILRKELKRQFLKVPFNGNQWIYETAYPSLMRFYWKIKSLLNKQQ